MDRYNHTQRIFEHLIVKSKEALINDEKKKHYLLVVTGTNQDLQGTVEKLQIMRDKGITFDLLISSMGEKLVNVEELTRKIKPKRIYTEKDWPFQQEPLNKAAGIVIPLLTQNTAVKLSLGIQDQLVPRLLWECLWIGKPVWMDKHSLFLYKGKPTANTALVNKIKEIVLQLEKLGIKEIEDFYGESQQPATENEIVINGNQFGSKTEKRAVITEKDILMVKTPIKELIIPKGSVITPLAKDTAKARGIRIIQQ